MYNSIFHKCWSRYSRSVLPQTQKPNATWTESFIHGESCCAVISHDLKFSLLDCRTSVKSIHVFGLQSTSCHWSTDWERAVGPNNSIAPSVAPPRNWSLELDVDWSQTVKCRHDCCSWAGVTPSKTNKWFHWGQASFFQTGDFCFTSGWSGRIRQLPQNNESSARLLISQPENRTFAIIS